MAVDRVHPAGPGGENGGRKYLHSRLDDAAMADKHQSWNDENLVNSQQGQVARTFF